MKAFCNFLVLFLLTLNLRGQGNFVPNPGFEFHSNCPGGSAQVYFATPWTQYNSADYFDTCATDSWCDIPNNGFGFQYPHTGEAYCGLGTFIGDPNLHYNYREFLQVKLSDTLKANSHYCINYFVSLADSSQFSCSNIGMYFSLTAINPITLSGLFFIINYTAQVENNPVNNPISDTMNWIEISGDYLAQGGETYITIGNFDKDSNSTWQNLQHGSNNAPGTYLYIDDVSIYENIDANAGVQHSICKNDSIRIGTNPKQGISYLWSSSDTFALSDSASANPWVKPPVTTTYYLTIADTGNLYCMGASTDTVTITVNDCTPPPDFFVPTILKGNELFSISALPPNTMLEIFDSRGRLVYKQENYQNDFSAVHLSEGVYVYRLSFSDNTVQKGKVCVVK
jgi:hypothetical protein